MQRRIRQAAVRRAGNAHAGEVKIIGAAWSKGELLWETKLRRQLGYDRWDTFARSVELAIAAKPLKVAADISVRAGQTVGRRRGKFAALFHNDLNILEAITQLAAAKVKGNGLQSVRAQCAGVQDFKDGAETESLAGIRGPAAGPEAGRNSPTVHTDRPRRARSILPPRINPAPVFDISVVLVQYSVPFVALGRAAFGLARACTTTSHGRRTQHIFHAAGCAVLAENQVCGVQVIPAYRMRYGIVRHKQAVGKFVLRCILLCGCHLRRELVGSHCPGIGKGHIAHCFVRQSIVHRAGDAHCREVKVIGAAGGKGELLVDFTRSKGRCRQQRQHHAAQQQDAKYSFLHWLFSSCSCRFGLSAPPFFRFSLILSRKHSAVIATAAAKETTATST